MNKMTIGIVGCGVGAVHHIPALKAVPDVDIVWFCDKSEERSQMLMKSWGKESKTGNDMERLLKNEKPDVVHICTPQATHADLTSRALEAGCHVLLEKPMALTAEECQTILKARDSSGYQLCMLHNHMFDPQIISVRQAVEKGILGKLICGEGRHFYETRKMKEEGLDSHSHWIHSLKSGTAAEFMPHTVYLLQTFFGPCRKMQLALEIDDTEKHNEYPRTSWAVQLKFDDAIGRILVVDYMPYGHFGIDIYGTQAAAHINMMDLTYSIERIRGFLPVTVARMCSTGEQSLNKLWQTFANSVKIATGQLKRRPGHRGLIKTFYAALRNGSPVPIPGEDGLATVQTMEMLDKAMDEYKSSEFK